MKKLQGVNAQPQSYASFFYGLPKDHKPSVPLRPVISGCDGPTKKTSCLLERILKQLLKFVPSRLWNTQDFNKIRSHSVRNGIPEGAIFFSIDVVNLYGSIPVTEAIDAVTEKLKKHLQGPISPSEYIPDYIQYSMRSKYASNTIRLHHLHICSTRLRLVAARMHSPWAGPISTNQSALASLFLFVSILSKTSLITY